MTRRTTESGSTRRRPATGAPRPAGHERPHRLALDRGGQGVDPGVEIDRERAPPADVDLGGDVAGQDRRDGDPGAPDVGADAFGEGVDRGLARAVRRPGLAHPPDARDRRDQHEVPGALRAEDLHRRLALGVRAEHVRVQDGAVGRRLAGADRRALADAGVDDEPVQPAQSRGEVGDDGRDRLGVVDVHRGHLDPDPGVGGEQFLLQARQPVDPAGGEGEVAAHGGEPAGHALTEPGAGAGDQDALTGGVRHRDSMPHPLTGLRPKVSDGR